MKGRWKSIFFRYNHEFQLKQINFDWCSSKIISTKKSSKTRKKQFVDASGCAQNSPKLLPNTTKKSLKIVISHLFSFFLLALELKIHKIFKDWFVYLFLSVFINSNVLEIVSIRHLGNICVFLENYWKKKPLSIAKNAGKTLWEFKYSTNFLCFKLFRIAVKSVWISFWRNIFSKLSVTVGFFVVFLKVFWVF